MPGQNAAQRLKFGVFEADLQTGELRKRGLRVRLPRQSFQVLAILLGAPGEIVSREQLKLSLWRGETFVEFDRAINKAITRIRQLLGDTPGTPRFVETIPGQGYRFIAPVISSVPPQESRERQSQHVLRSSLLPPPNTSFVPHNFAISPDGARLAFVAANSQCDELIWIRDLASGRVIQLEGTGGARRPFWSPDNRHLGFFSFGKLKTIDTTSGAIRTVCESRTSLGAAWHSSDVIVFAPGVTGPLCKVSPDGGTPMRATPAPPAQSSQLHCWPAFIPDSKDFLFFANRVSPQDTLRNGLYIASLDSDEVALLSDEIEGNVACALGYIVFSQKGSLVAQKLDNQERRLIAAPITIAQHEIQISERAWFHSGFSVSQSGVLVFQSALDFSSELQWFESSGRHTGKLPLRGCLEPTISPDGKLLAFASDEYNDGNLSICIYDFERDVNSRLTDGPNDWHPSWADRGTSIIYDQINGFVSSSWTTKADGSETPRRILPVGSVIPHQSINGDVVFMQVHQTGPSVCVWSPGSEEPVRLGTGSEPQFSPDGRWIAYVGPPLGIGVKPFPGPGPRIQISNVHAAQPRWSADGSQIFFVTSDRNMATASFDCKSGRAGPPHPLFQTRIIGSSLVGFQYDVSCDGRFLVNSLPSSSSPLTMLTGWQSIGAG